MRIGSTVCLERCGDPCSNLHVARDCPRCPLADIVRRTEEHTARQLSQEMTKIEAAIRESERAMCDAAKGSGIVEDWYVTLHESECDGPCTNRVALVRYSARV